MPTVFANRQPPTANRQRPTAHDPALIAHLTQELNDALNVHLAPTFAHLGDDWAEQIRPFHWVVAFPELFVDEAGQPLAAQAGFSVVIGNPPWEILKPDLREYYAQFDPEIESKLTRPQVEARISQLQQADPARQQVWQAQTAPPGSQRDLLQKRRLHLPGARRHRHPQTIHRTGVQPAPRSGVARFCHSVGHLLRPGYERIASNALRSGENRISL